ncbi:hypothetical protein PV703_11505 [Streptomyces sp. ME01-24h]|nr:hypothetical protein [Streptomyces sp. ME01-24h]
MTDEHTPACVICHRDLYASELGRYACRPCEQRIDRDLHQLAGPAGLYARLCLRIQPGRRGGDGPSVSRSTGSRMPLNEHVLSLTANGGIVSTLELWVEDWASCGLAQVGAGGRLQHRLDTAVHTLRLNLPRAVIRHAAIDDFAEEVSRARRQAEAAITGERQERPVHVVCPCGRILGFTVSTNGKSCRCGTDYTRDELFNLPLADRAAA